MSTMFPLDTDMTMTERYLTALMLIMFHTPMIMLTIMIMGIISRWSFLPDTSKFCNWSLG